MLAINADFTDFDKAKFSCGFKMKQEDESKKAYNKGIFILGTERFSVGTDYYNTQSKTYNSGLAAYNNLRELAKENSMIHRKLDEMGLITTSFSQMFDFKIFKLTCNKEKGSRLLLMPRAGTNDLLINVRIKQEDGYKVFLKASKHQECLIRFSDLTEYNDDLGRYVKSNETDNLYKLQRDQNLVIENKPRNPDEVPTYKRHTIFWKPRMMLLVTEIIDSATDNVIRCVKSKEYDFFKLMLFESDYYEKTVSKLLSLQETCLVDA